LNLIPETPPFFRPVEGLLFAPYLRQTQETAQAALPRTLMASPPLAPEVPSVTDLPVSGPFALVGAVLLALTAYGRGFYDGSRLSKSRLEEINRLSDRIGEMEVKMTAMGVKLDAAQVRLDEAHEENWNLKVMFNAIKEKNEELLVQLRHYEPITEVSP
jgi:hypothetical protein